MIFYCSIFSDSRLYELDIESSLTKHFLTLNPNPSLVLRWSDKPWILGTVTPGKNKIMTYESSTPFINALLAEHCLSVEFNRPDALNALRPEMLSETAVSCAGSEMQR